MRYWPFSVIRDSPLMPSGFAWELSLFYNRRPSEPTFRACLEVARHTTPIDAPNLLVVESEGAPLRYIFAGPPTPEEWLRLERSGVHEDRNGYLFMTMEALH